MNIYIQNNHILKDISLQLHDKKITCIIGPSGCGKTTLLKSINKNQRYDRTCTCGGTCFCGRKHNYHKKS
ncbi:MAG: ATP-binding cassette domain-containing protein [Coprobacter fastidiosus]